MKDLLSNLSMCLCKTGTKCRLIEKLPHTYRYGKETVRLYMFSVLLIVLLGFVSIVTIHGFKIGVFCCNLITVVNM